MDIKANINYALEGKFKVDIFDKQGKLIETTDWFNNFITASGLLQIYRYNFAECFRYLSLGSGTKSNYGNNPPSANTTTGIDSGILKIGTDLSIVDAVTGWKGANGVNGGVLSLSGQYIGPWGYVDGGASTFEDTTGPKFFRSWSIPYYDGNISSTTNPNGLTIQEFMVSPGDGSDQYGKYAFSRVKKTVIIPPDTSAIVSYQLGVRLSNTSLQFFNSGTFNTGSAETANELAQVGDWSRLSGYYRQTYHGLAWLDSFGQTFIPKYGNIMEPSFSGLSNSRFYLSPDNSQFDVNVTGGLSASEVDAYSADGLLKFIVEGDHNEDVDASPGVMYERSVQSTTLQTDIPSTESLPKNIRLKASDNDAVTIFPLLHDYGGQLDSNPDYTTLTPYDSTNYSTATPGATSNGTGYDSSRVAYGNKFIESTKGYNLPILTGLITGRTRKLTRKYSFLPAKSLGKNTRFGSLVYAYKTEADSDYYPMIDCLFYDSSGQSLMAHYREITGIYFTNRGSGIVEAYTYTVPELDKPFIHKTFQGPGTVNLNQHPALGGNV